MSNKQIEHQNNGILTEKPPDSPSKEDPVSAMSRRPLSRRDFLKGSIATAAVAGLAAYVPWAISTATPASAQTVTPMRRYRFFTDYQAEVIEAATARIIPADDTPGSREAGVVIFIDRALMEEDRALQSQYISGIGFLDHSAETKFQKPFLELAPEQQDEVLKSIEADPFFTTLRAHTFNGMFSDPVYGGNLDMVGWKLIQFNGAMFHPLDQGHLECGWRPGPNDYHSLLSRYGEINPYGQ
ncbi:MAG: gluconate 2-dehydrogenase subunit 3 family protein [Chloroflexi bacterium]|nr:gluconate 2-dehydrogenase subunit 3 family protein [Chloroflexota bacterium]